VKIGIDARNDRTGVGRYTFSLVRELAGIDRENEYILFLRKPRSLRFVPPAPNFRAVEADVPWFTVREQVLLPRLITRERLDLVHYPNVTVPLLATTPFVVTIHDLNYLDPAAIFGEDAGRNVARRALLTAGYRVELQKVRRARRLIAVSEHTRDELLSAVRIDPRKVAVTYEAPGLSSTLEGDRRVLEQHGITDPFFLYVGAAYPYKNLQRLIEAFAQFLESVSGGFRLVLAGDHEQFAHSLAEQARSLGVEDSVVFPGSVSEPELVALYDAALAFVFVSLREGFGLPGLEAMAAGLPVVAARTGSLPEIYGEAAEYCDPREVRSIAAALSRVGNDPGLCDRLAELGGRQAARFSWTQTARKTLQVYREAVSLPGA
jgi:glycosyltransferase involved in cell wall biosynthesis